MRNQLPVPTLGRHAQVGSLSAPSSHLRACDSRGKGNGMTATVSQDYLPNSGTAYTRRYSGVRAQSARLAAHLSPEDQQVQSMPDVSPTKWHLGHTTWFFETFILLPQLLDYRVFDSSFNYLFNSYYEAVGPRQLRAERGLITPPHPGGDSRLSGPCRRGDGGFLRRGDRRQT